MTFLHEVLVLFPPNPPHSYPHWRIALPGSPPQGSMLGLLIYIARQKLVQGLQKPWITRGGRLRVPEGSRAASLVWPVKNKHLQNLLFK